MDFYKIYVDIIGPILCSIVGGAFTVIGVYLTIRNERRKEAKENQLSNKPLFYRIDPMQDYDNKSSIDYIMKSNNEIKDYKLYGIFKNTEKAIMILDYISVNDKKYYPKNGNVVDKDKIFNLHIYLEEGLKSNDEVILVINDVLDNQYKYKIEFEANNKTSFIKSFREY